MIGSENPQNGAENKAIVAPGDLEALLPRLTTGRVFTGTRKIRLGDVDPEGRLRFDGLTRYTQDVSNDDTADAGLPEVPGWVVRSTVVDELVPGCLGETLTFETFCSSLGKRWAERRLIVCGDRGARYEVATLWVCVDPLTGPTQLSDQFLAIYGTAAGGRRAVARQRNPKLESLGERASAVVAQAWQLRRADLDTLGHVNNAAYWAAVEEWVGPFSRPRRARVEYGRGLSPAPHVGIARFRSDDDILLLWWLEEGRQSPSATAMVADLPPELYTG